MNIEELLSVNIRKAREEAQLSREKLAELVGITTQAIYYYESTDEKNRRSPSAATMYNLACYTKKPIEWFYINHDMPKLTKLREVSLTEFDKELSESQKKLETDLSEDISISHDTGIISLSHQEAGDEMKQLSRKLDVLIELFQRQVNDTAEIKKNMQESLEKTDRSIGLAAETFELFVHFCRTFGSGEYRECNESVEGHQ